MRKASQRAKSQPKDMHLQQMGSRFTTLVFLVADNGVPGMRIDNAGPFDARESRKLARWILDAFGESTIGHGPR